MLLAKLDMLKKDKTQNTQSETIPGRRPKDTIRLWERQKSHALIWRYVALTQIISTSILLLVSIIFYFNSDTIIEVPRKPEPGTYSVTQLPDAEFRSFAQRIINLADTYQPFTARRQFLNLRKYLFEPALSEFDSSYLSDENGKVNQIESIFESRQFRIDAPRVRVKRLRGSNGRAQVEVSLPGIRHKMTQDKHSGKPDKVIWKVLMETIPKNPHNEYGIVAVKLDAFKKN